MCFRPSTVNYSSNFVECTCPNCGETVAVEVGVTEGTCPNCKDFVSADPSNTYGFDPNQNYRVL